MNKWLNRFLSVILLMSLAMIPAGAVNEEKQEPKTQTVFKTAIKVAEIEKNTVEKVVLVAEAINTKESPVLPQPRPTTTTTDTDTSRYEIIEKRLDELESFQEESRERLGIIEREYVDINEVDRVSEQHCKCNN